MKKTQVFFILTALMFTWSCSIPAFAGEKASSSSSKVTVTTTKKDASSPARLTVTADKIASSSTAETIVVKKSGVFSETSPSVITVTDADFDGPELSEEEVLTWVKQYMPLKFSELEQLKKDIPEYYEMEWVEFSYFMRHLNEIKQEHPKMFERLIKAENLEIENRKLVEEIHQTEDSTKKQQLTEELRTSLEKIFEIRLEERLMEIQQLEEETQKMKALVEKRRAMKDKIIQHHLEEMTMPIEEGLEWW